MLHPYLPRMERSSLPPAKGGRPVSTTEQAGRRVRLLAHDQELGLRVPAHQIARARRELVAPVRRLGVGTWDVPAESADRRRLGYLLIEGLLAREIVLGEHTCAELLGEGDVLPPTETPRDEALIDYQVQWHVLQPVAVAVLDEQVWRELAHWPPVLSALLDRSIRRVQRMAVHQALLQLSPVETRLLVLFWYLAERWGRVTPAGIALRLRLSHEMLGHLVGVQRASVTTALGRIAPSGLVVRRSDGTWLLRGQPPSELAHIQWQDPGDRRDPGRLGARDGDTAQDRLGRARAGGAPSVVTRTSGAVGGSYGSPTPGEVGDLADGARGGRGPSGRAARIRRAGSRRTPRQSRSRPGGGRRAPAPGRGGTDSRARRPR